MLKSFIVDSTCNNMRLDRWLRRNIGNIPQSLIEKFLRSGKVKKAKLYYLRDRKGKSARISEKIKKKIGIDISEQIPEKETMVQNESIEVKTKDEPKKEEIKKETPKAEVKKKELKTEKK